jgi:hypothetical protein
MASQILPLSNVPALRALVFAWQGVNVQFPARSRSGLRDGDGTVVFAMLAAEVRVDDWGLSCLLWAPGAEAELLRHCRLAVRQGMAEGFVLHERDPEATRREGMLALRVVRSGREYWARWGHSVRAQPPRDAACAARTGS